MRKNAKRILTLGLSLVMIFGSMLTVNAATSIQHGEYGGDAYSAAMTLVSYSHVSASLSCTPESPSDVYSVRVDGLARSNFDGYDYVVQAFGNNSCYRQLSGDYENIRCDYYIGITQVEYMELYA